MKRSDPAWCVRDLCDEQAAEKWAQCQYCKRWTHELEEVSYQDLRLTEIVAKDVLADKYCGYKYTRYVTPLSVSSIATANYLDESNSRYNSQPRQLTQKLTATTYNNRLRRVLFVGRCVWHACSIAYTYRQTTRRAFQRCDWTSLDK